jgi:hypothetical protein
VNAILGASGAAPASGAERDRAAEAKGPELLERYGYLLEDFKRMHELFEILRTRREQRGSIDFDLPEAEVMLHAAGDIEAIRPTERNVAHRLIEEFMLAANETVARELVFANQPGLYRVHEQPDPQKLDGDWIAGARVVLAFLGVIALLWLQAIVEELGWRSYVLPRLMHVLGPWPGLLVHGVLWGLCYSPWFAVAGSSVGRSLGYVVTCCLFGVVLGWLRLSTRSIFASV